MIDLTELRRVASDALEFYSYDGDTAIAVVLNDSSNNFERAFNPKTALVLLDLLDKAIEYVKEHEECYMTPNRMTDFLAAVKEATCTQN